MDEESNKKKRIVLGVMLIAVVVVTLASTFAYFVSNTQSEPEKLTVTTGTLALTFSDNNAGITATSLSLGQSTTKQFKIENTGTLDVTTNMLWNNLVNTYTEGSLTYTFEYSTSETGPWIAVPNASGNIPQSESASDKTLAPDIIIPAHTTYYYQLTITLNHLADVDQTADKDAVLSSNFKLGDKVIEQTPAEKTLVALKTTSKNCTHSFAETATTDETADGLCSLPDDYGTSYYYRGAVTNNYVKFANKYWRIIRVNGDGSLRMIYDGTSAHANGESNNDRFTHTGKQYNSSRNDNAYVGWMYGTPGGTKEQAQTNTNNSTLKDLLNTWYDNTLASYDQYIADAVYCNDRSIPGKSVTGWSLDTGLGTGINATGYGALGRLTDTSSGITLPRGDAQPVFTCLQKNDAFTVSDSVHGNAIGTTKSRKIGLITADEIVAAGGRYYKSDNSSNNSSYYLYKGSWYWSLSPNSMNTNSYAYVVRVNTDGYLGSREAGDAGGAVAPVISLKAEYAVQMIGNGTSESPFQIPGVE